MDAVDLIVVQGLAVDEDRLGDFGQGFLRDGDRDGFRCGRFGGSFGSGRGFRSGGILGNRGGFLRNGGSGGGDGFFRCRGFGSGGFLGGFFRRGLIGAVVRGVLGFPDGLFCHSFDRFRDGLRLGFRNSLGNGFGSGGLCGEEGGEDQTAIFQRQSAKTVGIVQLAAKDLAVIVEVNTVNRSGEGILAFHQGRVVYQLTGLAVEQETGLAADVAVRGAVAIGIIVGAVAVEVIAVGFVDDLAVSIRKGDLADAHTLRGNHFSVGARQLADKAGGAGGHGFLKRDRGKYDGAGVGDGKIADTIRAGNREDRAAVLIRENNAGHRQGHHAVVIAPGSGGFEDHIMIGIVRDGTQGHVSAVIAHAASVGKGGGHLVDVCAAFLIEIGMEVTVQIAGFQGLLPLCLKLGLGLHGHQIHVLSGDRHRIEGGAVFQPGVVLG